VVESGLFRSELMDIDDSDFPRYLFQSNNAVFKIIQEEMEGLNDYCLLCIEATKNEYVEYKKSLDKLKNGEDKAFHPDFRDITYDVLYDGYNFVLPELEIKYDYISYASCLVLLSSFLEWSLKQLCEYYSNEDDKCKPSRGRKVGYYINFLRKSCNKKFDEPKKTAEIREKIRLVRNSYVHGVWDRLYIDMKEINLREAFEDISNLFYAIESACLGGD
jgi:hypothetical protein